MAVTAEDIQEAVKQLWNADATLSNVTTGLVKSLIMGRATDRATSPYTTLKVTDAPVQLTSQAAYMQTFTLEFRTWSETGAVNAGAIKVAIETVFRMGRTVLPLTSGRTLVILHSIKAPGALEQDPATQQSQPVNVATDRFEILCQG